MSFSWRRDKADTVQLRPLTSRGVKRPRIIIMKLRIRSSKPDGKSLKPKDCIN